MDSYYLFGLLKYVRKKILHQETGRCKVIVVEIQPNHMNGYILHTTAMVSLTIKKTNLTS